MLLYTRVNGSVFLRVYNWERMTIGKPVCRTFPIIHSEKKLTQIQILGDSWVIKPYKTWSKFTKYYLECDEYMEYDKGNLISQKCAHDIFNICVKCGNGKRIGKSKIYTE